MSSKKKAGEKSGKVKILLSNSEGNKYKILFQQYSVKNAESGNKKRVPANILHKVLSCAENLDLEMLYAIWERVIDDNKQDIDDDSQIAINFLKESQFYMACKLVAIYQMHYNELMTSGKKISEILPFEIINKHIQTPMKDLAKFDFSNYSENNDNSVLHDSIININKTKEEYKQPPHISPQSFPNESVEALDNSQAQEISQPQNSPKEQLQSQLQPTITNYMGSQHSSIGGMSNNGFATCIQSDAVIPQQIQKSDAQNNQQQMNYIGNQMNAIKLEDSHEEMKFNNENNYMQDVDKQEMVMPNQLQQRSGEAPAGMSFQKNDSQFLDDTMIPRQEPNQLQFIQQPQPMVQQTLKLSNAESEGSYEESFISDLKQNDFSVSISEAKIVNEKSNSYLSYLTTASYAVFKIETQSRLPNYGNDQKLHQVYRRFSDFEYLLKTLQENEDYKNHQFPMLGEKKIMGNLDEKFIEKRRVELEGFLRVLVSMDQRVKRDANLSAFLTFDEEKYKEFKQNPHPYTDKMWNMYSQLPSFNIKEMAQQGVTQTMKQAVNRVKNEIQDIEEPPMLKEDANFLDFESIYKTLDRNLHLLTEAQTEFEIQQNKFNEQFQQMQQISNLMLDIQNLIVQDYDPQSDQMRVRNQELIDQSSLQIRYTKKLSQNKQEHSTQMYSQSKSLKQTQELVTIIKGIQNSIHQRKALVKQYVLQQQNQEQKKLELGQLDKQSEAHKSKINLSDQIQKMSFQLSEIRQEIHDKYNKNIVKDMKRLDIEQETKLLKFISALGKSQQTIHQQQS